MSGRPRPPHFSHGMVWVPISSLAEEYHKSKCTIWRWISDGFLVQLGYCIKREPGGYWYAGKHIE